MANRDAYADFERAARSELARSPAYARRSPGDKKTCSDLSRNVKRANLHVDEDEDGDGDEDEDDDHHHDDDHDDHEKVLLRDF